MCEVHGICQRCSTEGTLYALCLPMGAIHDLCLLCAQAEEDRRYEHEDTALITMGEWLDIWEEQEQG